MERVERVERLARWWTQAKDEARFMLLRRIIDHRSPKEKEDPTLDELRLAIYLAETAAGEVDQAGAAR